MSALLVPLLLLQVTPAVMLSVVPDGREILKEWLSVDFTQVVLVLTAALLVVNVGLLMGAMARFQRARLVS
jgi:hypothetical protein